MSCTVPANQPIYQALLDKATYYSSVLIIQKEANKYKNAANGILSTRANVYSIAQNATNIWNFEEDFDDEYDDKLPHIGNSIKHFIFDSVKDHS
jgi:hypothetical protein